MEYLTYNLQYPYCDSNSSINVEEALRSDDQIAMKYLLKYFLFNPVSMIRDEK